MATAGDLITRALRRARALGRDQTASDEDASDGLIALNTLLDMWWNERLAVFHELLENFSLVAGTASYTIGSGGTFDTTRPVKVLGGFTRRSGVDSPFTMLEDRAQYAAIPDKTVQGIPQYCFYDAAYPLGTLYFHAVPDAADDVYIRSQARLQSFASLTTAISLPPGYEQLIVDGLAIDRAPEYGLAAPADVVRSFAKAMRVLKRINSPAPVIGLDPALERNVSFDIVTG